MKRPLWFAGIIVGVLLLSLVGTVVFAPNAIQKLEQRNLREDEAVMDEIERQSVRDGRCSPTELRPSHGKTGELLIVKTRLLFPFVMNAKMQIRYRELVGTEFERTIPVDAIYLWTPIGAFRISDDPWGCKGVRIGA
jgi:hypothetical protein